MGEAYTEINTNFSIVSISNSQAENLRAKAHTKSICATPKVSVAFTREKLISGNTDYHKMAILWGLPIDSIDVTTKESTTQQLCF